MNILHLLLKIRIFNFLKRKEEKINPIEVQEIKVVVEDTCFTKVLIKKAKNNSVTIIEVREIIVDNKIQTQVRTNKIIAVTKRIMVERVEAKD